MRRLLCVLLLSGAASAQTGELDKLRQELEDAKKRIDALEKAEKEAKERADLMKEMESEAPAAAPSSSGIAAVSLGGGAQAKLLDLSFDLLATGGVSTARDPEIRQLQAGDHDPHRRGFTIQNFEITGTGAIDPYFNGEAHIVLKIDHLGETTIELEEAFLTTTSLPFGFQVKAGQMFESFGRINPTHPHTWQFVDAPVVATRFLGPDGLRSQGAEVSWLAPTPFFLLVTAGAFNANGGTEFSFINEEAPPYYVNAERRDVASLRDVQYVARAASNFDLGDTVSTTIGASWAHGPNSTGGSADTNIYGADFYARWKPLQNDQGWPFVQFQAEWMGRSTEQARGLDDAGTYYKHDTFWDWGWYAQAVWGFTTHWTAGVRFDNARGELGAEQPDNPLHDNRYRCSAMLTYYPSEFSKIRLQYNYDHASHISSGHDSRNDEHSVWLQIEFLLGKHGAHKF